MKILTLRSSVALACALSLAACGGGDGNLQLAGSSYNVTMAGLELINNSNGDKVAVAAGQQTFFFPKLLSNDENFDVTVATQPDNAVCTVTTGKGMTGSFNIGSVVVTCVTKTHELGGQVSGLNTGGLVLVNGSDKVVVPAGATTFKLANVGEGSPYGVTILSQPVPRNCSVAQGVGTMGKTAPNNIVVTCI